MALTSYGMPYIEPSVVLPLVVANFGTDWFSLVDLLFLSSLLKAQKEQISLSIRSNA